jgi:hypothetical protein
MSDPSTRLPGLQAYGHDLHQAMRSEERRQVRRRRRRRFVVAFAGATALVPTAIATRNVWAPSPNSLDPRAPLHKSAPVIIEEGVTAEGPWRLSVFDSNRGRCLQLELRAASTGPAAGCSDRVPAQSDLDVLVAGGRQSGFVYGATSASVRRVRVEYPGRAPREIATRQPSADVLRRNGTRADFRTYVVDYDRPVDPSVPFRVLALDAGGAVVDTFSLG